LDLTLNTKFFEFSVLFDKMLSDIGRDVIFKKMTNIENCSIFAVYQGQVVGGCVFTPHFDLNFIELHFLGVDQRCQNSVSEYYITKF
jgi:hypothetical protein